MACVLLAACGGLAGCGSPVTAEGAILRVGNGAEVQGLDPHTVSGVTEHRTLGALFEGLVSLDPATLEPIPGVAQSWELSADARTYTFHLRDDARWSNGDPVTAHDFAYAWRRILSPALGADYAYLLHCIEGAQAFNNGELSDFGEVGVNVLDDRTLQVTLENPTPYFLRMQIHQTYFPIHQPTIETFGAMNERGTKWTRAGNLVGNGPFRLTEWTPDTIIRVEKNEHYWDADNIRLDGIWFYPIDNLWTEERAFRSGELHITGDVPLHKVGIYRDERPDEIVLHPYLGTYYYRLNVTAAPFDDVRVRRAFAMALDQREIANKVLQGGETPAHFYTPPDTGGYTCEYKIPYDPGTARALLAEAGYPNGAGLPPVEILYNNSEAHKLVAEAVQALWKQQLGADVRLMNQDWKVYLSTMNNLEYMVARSGWIADVPDPINFLECFLSGSGNNRTGYSNPKYDALINRAYAEADPQRRFEILQEAEEILLKEAPIVPIYFYARKYLKKPFVRGLEPNPLGYIRWNALWLENTGTVLASPRSGSVPAFPGHAAFVRPVFKEGPKKSKTRLRSPSLRSPFEGGSEESSGGCSLPEAAP